MQIVRKTLVLATWTIMIGTDRSLLAGSTYPATHLEAAIGGKGK